MSAFRDHFSARSEEYAAYRPVYPVALVDFLASVSPDANLALDCGCGTGQLSVLLAARFREVVATDASAAQIKNAKVCFGVTYRVAAAEESGLPEGVVDLVTVAQAAHWFDLPAFYAEVLRVARPGAIIALVTYGHLHTESGCDRIIRKFYRDTLGPYWPPERRQVEDGYRSLPFPFSEIEPPRLTIEASWNLFELVGYLDTWSAVRALEKQAGPAPLESLRRELTEVWGDAGARHRVQWPLALRVGRIDKAA